MSGFDLRGPDVPEPAPARRGLVSVGQLRSDCLRLLAHDLNNPLTAIRILAEMMRDQVHEPEMRQDVVDILEAADLASAQMDSLSTLVQLEARSEEYTWFPTDLAPVLRQAVDRPCFRRSVRLDLARPIRLNGDHQALCRAMTDVLLNARKLVEGDALITVRSEEAPDHVAIRVHHPGEGVPRHLRDRLFELYGAVSLRRERIPVAAAGLVYARKVIEVHGGTMVLEDPPGAPARLEGRGMDLVIRLPR